MDTEVSPLFWTPLRRIALILLTLIIGTVMTGALVASWNEPQVASRLELYQTDLLLQATAWEGEGLPAAQAEAVRQNLLGEQPLKSAQETYESVRETAVATLEAPVSETSPALSPRLRTALDGQAELLDLIDLRLGILRAQQGQLAEAMQAWQAVQERQARGSSLEQTAAVLIALWHDQPLPADAESLLQTHLQGWFRNRALEKLYRRTAATDRLTQVLQTEAESAASTVMILAIVGTLPVVGALLGLIILVGVGVQWLLQGSDSLLARSAHQGWHPPWSLETIGWVVIGGFLGMGQLVVPVLISPLRSPLSAAGSRGQALLALVYYLLMATGAIAVLWVAIRRYRPLPQGWFHWRWGRQGLLWGLGGYLAALPLMLIVSLLNQRLWQGQGGSNPLLQTVLEAQDPVALAIFFVTAAIAAPLFEEFLFRGFLLPSLTRYLSVGGAIVLSSFIFAIAHLSLSEVLPLMTLGMVLGVVYTRSRNLLAPMLLHSAWNSVTMLGLFLLGSSTQ